MSELFVDPQFWIGLGEIIVVNIILSGDNAVVIALAARSLPERQRQLAVIWGSVAAILMRVVLTIVAVEMLKLPYLKIVGSLLLFWIALQLLLPESDGGDGIDDHDNLIAAIRTILIADLVMSLDNVIAVAAAAKGDVLLLVLGLAISIPLVIFGSTIILRLMDRFPVIIVLGAALLGFVSGEMLVTDPAWPEAEGHWLREVIPIAGAVLVVVAGKWLAKRKATMAPHRVVDLASQDEQPKSGKIG
ncbi:TerC family protein [Methylocaldum sp.]|uniref:TerC family protein n=1 Tax=Methylocaldum sp. TaxID=1969727 RepID=UPI002D60794F|nr:TerC family protein [Methylocaldum sp.]HYE35740.1 TerC family protein [Methylocaldum sp.]